MRMRMMTGLGRMGLAVVLFAAGIMVSCRGPGGDTVYVNGAVITMDASLPEVEAFAVRDGKIVRVGSTVTIEAAFPEARVVDLAGRVVMPGIIESHGHLLSLGQSFLELNLEGVAEPGQAVKRVAERIKQTPAGEWIVGWGWDEGAWAEGYPDNAQLSRVSPDHPVYLRGLHGFASWTNKKALEIAGITAETPDPPGGRVLRDPETQCPTGILMNKAQDLLKMHVPPLRRDQVEKALILACRECLKYGITTVHEARTTADMLEAFRSLKADGRLELRLYCMLDAPDRGLLAPFFRRGPEIDPDHWLTVRCVKVFVDGALGSRGAAMIEPYSDDPEAMGVIVTPEDSLYAITARCLRSGLQVAAHAIGDRANRITLNAYRRALEAEPDARDSRLRVEHAQVTATDDIPKFAPLGVVLSMQPPHATSDMGWAETRVGPERIRGAYAWRSFLDTGVRLTLNSDFPGETLNPFWGMYAAETRRSPSGGPEGGWYPEQSLTREETLRAYTIEAAYSGFEEKIKGKIMPGMLADFIVLSEDIRTIPSRALLTLRVEQTYVGGRRIYELNGKR